VKAALSEFTDTLSEVPTIASRSSSMKRRKMSLLKIISLRTL
jgi:hypothetical protein